MYIHLPVRRDPNSFFGRTGIARLPKQRGKIIVSMMDQRQILNEDERRKILDDIHVGIWRIEETPGQPVRMFGDANMYAILGAAPETTPEELYRHWHSRIEPVYLSYVNNAVNQLISTGAPAEVEYIWNHPQRGKTVVRCDATLVSSPAAGKIGMLGMHRDITDKLTVCSREDKSHHFVDQYKMSLCGRYLFRAYEDIFFVDRAAGRLYPVAYRPRPALSMEDSWDIYSILDKCVPPVDREQVHRLFSRESMERLAAGGGSASVDFRRLDGQGAYAWVRGTLYPVPINGMEELLFVVQDIQNEQKAKALKAEKEDVLYSIIHPSSVIYEWDIGDVRMQVLKHDLLHFPGSPDGDSVFLPELVEQLCGHYLDISEHPKARAFLTYETMASCASEQRKGSITLLLDSAKHKYDWVKAFILPSSLSRTKAYLVLEMMDRKEGLYPILESYIRAIADYCYCIDLKTGYFFRFIGDERGYAMPAREGHCYTREMEAHVDRFVVEEERALIKKQMHPETILKALETEVEYSFVENILGENGEILRKRLTFTPFHQSKGYVLLQSIDITELNKKDRMLEAARRESVTDPLTQLYNRLGGRAADSGGHGAAEEKRGDDPAGSGQFQAGQRPVRPSGGGPGSAGSCPEAAGQLPRRGHPLPPGRRRICGISQKHVPPGRHSSGLKASGGGDANSLRTGRGRAHGNGLGGGGLLRGTVL